jgi:hypothetical protein
MEVRTKKIIFYSLDLIFAAFLISTITVIIVKQFLVKDYPFMVVYIYLQYVATYLTFRLKHFSFYIRDAIVNRIHIFNFMFSVFNMIIGYVEMADNIDHGHIYQPNKGYFFIVLSATICAHIVIMAYLFCPRAIMDSYWAARRRDLLLGSFGFMN